MPGMINIEEATANSIAFQLLDSHPAPIQAPVAAVYDRRKPI
jgi:hypothetical protein